MTAIDFMSNELQIRVRPVVYGGVLYRLLGDDDELLYVGSTHDIEQRLQGSGYADWQHEIKIVEIEFINDRQMLLATERYVIMNEHPKYNKQWNHRPVESVNVPPDDVNDDVHVLPLRRSSESQQLLREALLRSQGIGPRELARISGYHEQTVHRHLNKLMADGSVVRAGYGRYRWVS